MPSEDNAHSVPTDLLSSLFELHQSLFYVQNAVNRPPDVPPECEINRIKSR